MFKFAFGFVLALITYGSVAHAQAAPALTGLRVLGVSSTGFGLGRLDSLGIPSNWDLIANGQFATGSAAHSGPVLWVATYEAGYSVTRQAKFNGTSMVLVASEPVPRTGPAYGWIRYWRLNSSFTSGQFTTSATSVRTFRQLSTFINIR